MVTTTKKPGKGPERQGRGDPSTRRSRRRPEPVFRGGLSYMTSKGQVTITANLRATLGLKPGDRVLMMLQDDGTLKLRRLRPLDELIGSLGVEGVDIRSDWRDFEELAQEELARGALKYMDRKVGEE